MLKKFKKLGLALLLPATAMVIATPLVLTSCNASESLVIESEKQNNENLVVDSTTSDQTQTKEKIVTNLSSANHSKEELIDDYLFPELVREFIDYPIIEGKLVSGVATPTKGQASKSFQDELQTDAGFLNAAIKVFNFDEEITNIKIKEEANNSYTTQKIFEKFTITPAVPANGSTPRKDPSLSIPVTIDFKSTTTSGSKTSTTITHNYTLKITPYIATFDIVEDSNILLDIFSRYVASHANHYNKKAVEVLHDEFSKNVEGKESVLEQVITKGLTEKDKLNRQSGLVSYDVELTLNDTTPGTGETEETHHTHLYTFVPFKIKGNYRYYLDNYNKPIVKLSSTDLTNNN